MPNPIGSPSTKPIIEPITTASLAPLQPDTSYWVEWKNSRQIRTDLQRGTIVHVYVIAGRPDQVARDASVGGLREGMPHKWEKDAYVAGVTFEHHIHGPDPETAELTPGTARESKGYTKVTVTYRQMPWPGKWEEDYSVALVGRLEWFDRGNPPKQLRGSQEGTSILIPVPTYRRHFPRSMMSRGHWDVVLREIGKTNASAWQTQPANFWLFTGVRSRLLFGDPADTAAWEVTLMFRGDPERHHEWWWPQYIKQEGKPGLLPKNPGPLGDRSRRDAFLEDGIFTNRRIYDSSETDWDTMIPLRGTPRDPP